MRPAIQIDASAVTNGLRYMARQIPFAMSRAINLTANDAQTAIRKGIASRMTVATERIQFIDRLVKIRREDRSSKREIRGVIVGVEAPGAKDAATAKSRRIESMLTRHEAGGQQQQKDNPFYIPTKHLRPTATTLVPRGLYPTSLRLADRKDVSGATLPGLMRGKVKAATGKALSNKARREQRIEGLMGTFRINAESLGASGIYQRTGRGRRQIVKLWQFARRVTLAPRLQFVETVQKTVNDRWEINAGTAVDEAIRTAFEGGAKSFASGIVDEIAGGLS